MERERLETRGCVRQALPNAMFQVELDSGRQVRCHVGQQAKMILIKVLPGDRVRVQLSANDTSRGKIVGRDE